jgi:hypothetical protein
MQREGGTDSLTAFINQQPGAFEALLWFDSPDHFAGNVMTAPDFLRGAVGPHVTLEGIHFMAHANGRAIGLAVEGRSFAPAGRLP